MDLSVAFQNFSKIIHLSDDDKRVFSDIIEVVHLPKKSFLLKQGTVCHYEYFVLKGCLRSFYRDENGKEHTTMFAIEGWWTGDLKSFLLNVPAEFNIQALEDTIIFRLNRQQSEQLFEKIPQFERYFRILLQRRLIATEDRVNRHLSADALFSYAEFCKKYPNIEQRVPQKYIASYLGITSTYLSRLRNSRLKIKT